MGKSIFVLATLVLAVSMISLVSAGVGYPYFTDGVVTMAPGETKILDFSLSNIDAEGKLFAASITSGSEVASFDKKSYIVQSQQKITANLRLKIPSSAVDGQEYPITVSFSEGPVVENPASGAAMGIGTSVQLLVRVKKPEVESTAMSPQQMWMIAGIAVVVLAIILWLSLGKKKKRK